MSRRDEQDDEDPTGRRPNPPAITTLTVVHKLDLALDEDLHKFLDLYEKSVNAKDGILEAIKRSQTAILNAVEHSQSALMMRLDLIEKAIAKLEPAPGDQPVNLERLKTAAAQSKEVREAMQAILAENPPQ